MEIIKEFIFTFWQYLIDIAPYFILALLITTFLEVYTSLNWLKKALKNEKIAPLFAGLLGGSLPVCSCSMIPVALMINSLSRSYAPTIAFLMVAPVVSPITIILTYGFFGLKLTLVRVIGTLILALLVAYTISFFFKKPLQISMASSPAVSNESKFNRFIKSFISTFKMLAKYILLGLLIASLIKVLIPSAWISYIAGKIFSYPLISALSIPIYVCSGEEVPIAKALIDIGFTYGNALTFMLASSGICIPTIMATLSFLPKKIVFLYAGAWFVISTFLGYIYDLVF